MIFLGDTTLIDHSIHFATSFSGRTSQMRAMPLLPPEASRMLPGLKTTDQTWEAWRRMVSIASVRQRCVPDPHGRIAAPGSEEPAVGAIGDAMNSGHMSTKRQQLLSSPGVPEKYLPIHGAGRCQDAAVRAESE